ncbi:glycine zipper domain-containing protein [Chondromyces crocatus]|nr:glycine zipper domain-containing protein [Chondromyces crocatus]
MTPTTSGLSDQAPHETVRAPDAPDEAHRPVQIHHTPSAPAALMEVLTGAAAGAALGAMIGPPGIAVGAMVGGLVGAAAEVMLDRDRARAAQHEAELDMDIGVLDGHIGEAPANQTSPVVAAYNAATVTLTGGTMTPVEPSGGPIQNVDAA